MVEDDELAQRAVRVISLVSGVSPEIAVEEITKSTMYELGDPTFSKFYEYPVVVKKISNGVGVELR